MENLEFISWNNGTKHNVYSRNDETERVCPENDKKKPTPVPDDVEYWMMIHRVRFWKP